MKRESLAVKPGRMEMEIESQQGIMGNIDYYYLGLIYHP